MQLMGIPFSKVWHRNVPHKRQKAGTFTRLGPDTPAEQSQPLPGHPVMQTHQDSEEPFHLSEAMADGEHAMHSAEHQPRLTLRLDRVSGLAQLDSDSSGEEPAYSLCCMTSALDPSADRIFELLRRQDHCMLP